MTPDLVIFDCDGVLVDSEPLSNRVLVDNLARHGLTLTLDQAMGLFVGGTMAGVGAKARDLGADLPDDWVDRIYAETYARLREGVDPIPGISALLDRLDAAGLPYCVASNGSEEKMAITLGATGLAPRFEGRRYSAHTLGTAKPDPALFQHAARACGVAPERCIVVEDSATGAEAARRANMPCLGYAPTGDGARLSAQGARIIRDMAEIAAMLGLPAARVEPAPK
ncbi:Putative phosphatase YieH [Roseibacterium elongatum DSM 19469]|uniref:phosphoglycolate phosphatase n=1 Tax=Roseicyclus elongatus DSM 19469 TaxID=1294273 RepID=W8SMP5_9RHOB|nr:HAD family hydrolase [Roseibacterium elongatum]AHM03805.1 Putative phosphatase YieH [Roseibacterium elongatum DSM 19469]